MLAPVMAASVTLDDPAGRSGSVLLRFRTLPASAPVRMPSPFAPGVPHPLAAFAIAELRRELAAGLAERLGLARDGKMFGVLVVRDREGQLGWLRAFSGMIGRSWELAGFVPPAFDQAARDAFWIAGERALDRFVPLLAEHEARLVELDAQLAALDAQHGAELATLKRKHIAAKSARDVVRGGVPDEATLAALAHQSNRDRDERRQLLQTQRSQRAELLQQVEVTKRARDAVADERADASRSYTIRIYDTYRLANARGETRSLRELFAPHEPPGGAGDCAAPKLLAHAYREGLVPIALGEVWCGAPPATGGRSDGTPYPACRGKCGPILGHMLAGLDVDSAPVFDEDAIDPAAPATLFEDDWLAVIVKPAGLLSVPGRNSRADSLLVRLRRRYPDATGPLLPHRLDLDTSGVMLVAKDLATHGALQRQFSERTIEKRYVAVLDGEPATDGGTIELPIRVDLEDRPRQIVDPVHGKHAITQWRVTTRVGGRTRVELVPRTGRAHQLRVHAAHPAGIGVPIVGDRLYGRPDLRLLLDAEAIAFVHPHTHERLQFEHSPPF
jgi:tRNA pseudouridine32 synthase / 23S rRNA pseudouridine746 synthase